MASDIKIQILQSGTTTTIAPDNNILTSGELAYTYANGDSSGGDRLFIGAGGNDSPNGFATEIHTIGGKYYTDMMDHPRGQTVPQSAIITDENNKISEITIDNIAIDGNEINTSSGNLTLNPNGGTIDASTSTLSNVVDPSSAQDAATKNYVDTKDIVFVSADVNENGLGNVQTSKTIQISGAWNTNTKRIDQPDNAVKVEVNVDSDLLGLSKLTVDNIDINGNTITTTDGNLRLLSTSGIVTVDGNLIVNGTTTTVNSTELTIADKNIILASGAANPTAADSAGIHVDGAHANIYYDAPTDTWNFNKDIVAPNLTGDTITGIYSGFDSDFAAKSTTDLSEGTNLYYTTVRFDSDFNDNNTDNLSEGSTNLYFTEARARASVNATQTGGDGVFTYDQPSGVFTYDGPTESNYRAAFSATGDLSYNQSTGVFSIDVEQVYSKANFDSDLGDANTGQLPEGSNLYYTDARFDSALGTKTTDDLTEGSNLYFTNERVDDRIATTISAGTGIQTNYDDPSDDFAISLLQASSTQLGGAKFDSVDFLVTSGNVELATIDCGTY